MKTSFVPTLLMFLSIQIFFCGCFPDEENDCNLSVTVTASGASITAIADNGSPPYNYLWSNGSTGSAISGLAAGVYSVTSTDNNNCTATGSATVTSGGSSCTQATVTDADGNVYNTVSIGSQCWLASNLKTTKYRDGTPIPNITDGWEWANLTTGAYCDYENTPANSATYGRLYNWYAVNTGNVCPVGWHVPSDSEWKILEAFLGEESLAGGKLKEAGFIHWQSPNTAATNETGFTALPAGSRFSTGSFFNLGYDGYWWTSTTGTDPAYAWYHWVDFNSGFVIISEDYKTDGISVRCVKD